MLIQTAEMLKYLSNISSSVKRPVCGVHRESLFSPCQTVQPGKETKIKSMRAQSGGNNSVYRPWGSSCIKKKKQGVTALSSVHFKSYVVIFLQPFFGADSVPTAYTL
ncbi:hypothetical protein RRG08_027805 [Elysia crispata]|uniref:Uncharacterized protein n=1 Tax=Elysia crispata TaxID=231223 RepID=A0AAE1D6F5_9GAST|nr:hypothetical protein RRG08_027805 [Elysia crispata]